MRRRNVKTLSEARTMAALQKIAAAPQSWIIFPRRQPRESAAAPKGSGGKSMGCTPRLPYSSTPEAETLLRTIACQRKPSSPKSTGG